jgi:hypothetical protein
VVAVGDRGKKNKKQKQKAKINIYINKLKLIYIN